MEGLEPTECIGAMKVMDTKKYIIAHNTPEMANEIIDGHERNGLIAVSSALTAGAGPAIISAYGSYTTWFVGTSFAASLSTVSVSSISASLASQFTLRGMFQSSLAERVVNSSTNFFGQVASTNYGRDENINYAQPLAAFIIGNSLLENITESTFYLNSNGNFGVNSLQEGTNSFYSNIFGDLLSKKFDALVKPINDFSKGLKSAIDIYGGTGIEIMESKFSDIILEPLNEQFNTSESIKNMNNGMKQLKD